MKNDWLSFL